MLFVQSSQIAEGMCVAEDVHDQSGRILIARGQRIGPSHLVRLQKFGIQSLFIDGGSGARPAEPPKTDLRKQCETVFRAVYAEAKSGGTTVRSRHSESIAAASSELVRSLRLGDCRVVTLSGSSEERDLEPQHAVNSAALAVAIGIDQKLSSDALRELGSAMLLHDIGFALLPRTSTEGTAQPTPDQIQQFRAHTLLGYNYVLRTELLHAGAAEILLSHHERMNGSGYPRALSGEKLSVSMRIAAVADTFDALTSRNRFGLPPALPDAALEWMQSRYGLYDNGIAAALGHRVIWYPDGVSVRLTTGEIGTVAGTLPHASSRPVVLIHSDSKGRVLPEPIIVDLMTETGRSVARSAPTLERLHEMRSAASPGDTIDPTLFDLI